MKTFLLSFALVLTALAATQPANAQYRPYPNGPYPYGQPQPSVPAMLAAHRQNMLRIHQDAAYRAAQDARLPLAPDMHQPGGRPLIGEGQFVPGGARKPLAGEQQKAAGKLPQAGQPGTGKQRIPVNSGKGKMSSGRLRYSK